MAEHGNSFVNNGKSLEARLSVTDGKRLLSYRVVNHSGDDVFFPIVNYSKTAGVERVDVNKPVVHLDEATHTLQVTHGPEVDLRVLTSSPRHFLAIRVPAGGSYSGEVTVDGASGAQGSGRPRKADPLRIRLTIRLCVKQAELDTVPIQVDGREYYWLNPAYLDAMTELKCTI